MNYIAFVTKGLESISQRELTSISGVTIQNIGDKFIRFHFEGDLKLLAQLRTVDDVGLLVDEFSISGEQNSIAKLINLDNLEERIGLLKETRSLGKNFSVTVSIYKSPQFHRDNLQQEVADAIASRLKLEFTPLDHSNIDVRVNIDKSECFTTLKLFSHSLYKRDYEHTSHIGALRSTIAAAMLYELSGSGTGLKLVDNFCGSGTLLCEGIGLGYEVYGGDIELNVVDIAKQNLRRLGISNPNIITQNATNTKLPNRTFDVGVANFPWDKQIEISNISPLLAGAIKEYARNLKPRAKLGFISTKPELVLKYMKKYFQVKNLREFKIGYLGQTPTIQLAEVEPM